MNISQTKNIKIIEFLKSIGIEPVALRGINAWYNSPIREDKHPSFSVNTEKNLWYDLGLSQGGDLIKLIQLMHNCNTSEALRHIANSSPQPLNSFSFDRNKQIVSIITKKIPGVSNPVLIEYLKSRGLNPQLTGHYLWNIEYRLGKKTYFGIGFINDSNGFEIRNKYFKGCLGVKDITTIHNQSSNCCLFEGWPDFLTYIQYYKQNLTDFLILNSASMLGRAIDPLRNYLSIHYWGQSDNTGNDVLQQLFDADLNVKDCRHEFIGFKDLNDKHKVQ